MAIKIQIHRDELKRILDSFHHSKQISDNSDTDPVDLNMHATSPDKVEIHRMHMGYIQISHELTNEGEISVSVDEDRDLIFTSKILHSIVSKARKEKLIIKFFEDEYAIRLSSQSTFSTPTSLDLRLVSQDQFEPLEEFGGMSIVTEVERMPLLETLEAMGAVSNVVTFKLVNDEMWISVSDIVEGKGKVMKSADPECKYSNLEFKYHLEPLVIFLKKLDMGFVSIYVNQDGVLMVKAKKPGHEATLHLAQRVDEV